MLMYIYIYIFFSDACSANKISKKDENYLPTDGDNIEPVKRQTDSTKPLTSRENEIDMLKTFLIEHLQKEESSSIYISGQPGTGKTASLSHILKLPMVSYSEDVYLA